MATENFSWAREYLNRHGVHRLWEDCVEELIQQRPAGQAEVTKCIVSKVQQARGRIAHPAKMYYAVIGEDVLNVTKEFVDGKYPGTTVVDWTDKTSSFSAAEMQILVEELKTVPGSNIAIVGFPKTVGQAIAFEAIAGAIQHCIVVLNATDYNVDEQIPAPSRDSSNFQSFVKGVNPLLQYFNAHAKAQLCVVGADGSRGPAETFRRLLSQDES